MKIFAALFGFTFGMESLIAGKVDKLFSNPLTQYSKYYELQ